jgi:putative methionine-R-sulfoxide reductase with GAF domain
MAVAPFQELPAGTRLGRWTIQDPISNGAMGAVFRALDEGSGERAAIKRMITSDHAARFEVEARLLAQLDHPRVVDVIEHFADGRGRYCIAMRLIEGADLGAVVQERGNPGLPVDEVTTIAQQACEALQYVHEQQIVHRDVKPQNLILGEDGVTLVDFGVAREVSATRTATMAIGTPGYMAPEIFAGAAVSPRSDVFSLAATVWALLAGRPPQYGDAHGLADTVAGVTPELEATLRDGLEMVPERRIASAAAFAEALGRPVDAAAGASLARSLPQDTAARSLLEAVVRAAAGVFEAAASSVALIDERTGELVYQAAWGAGADDILGVRLSPGVGIAGAVAASGEAQAVADCRADSRFASAIAEGTRYVPVTMVTVPLRSDDRVIGVLQILDRRDGGAYDATDLSRALVFAELAESVLASG